MTGFRTPRPPTFERVEDEQRHRKERLAAAFRLFGRMGFGDGAAGHITVRDPGRPDPFWVNPFGQSFRHVSVSDLVLVGPDGAVVEGDNPVAFAALTIHAAVHNARPDAVAVAHAHSFWGKTFSMLGRPLAPLSQDACAFFEHHSLHDTYTGVVLEAGEGEALARALGPNKAVILRNHGLLTVGGTLDACAWWFISMETCCHSQLAAEASASAPIEVPPEHARLTASQVGSERWGWFSFQPLWDWIAAEEPDLFD